MSLFLGLILIDEINYQLSPKGKRKRNFRIKLTKKEAERLQFEY